MSSLVVCKLTGQSIESLAIIPVLVEVGDVVFRDLRLHPLQQLIFGRTVSTASSIHLANSNFKYILLYE